MCSDLPDLCFWLTDMQHKVIGGGNCVLNVLRSPGPMFFGWQVCSMKWLEMGSPVCIKCAQVSWTYVFWLTGMQHEVIGGGQPYGVGLNETFLSQLLKQVNYSTHLVGKVMFISQLRCYIRILSLFRMLINCQINLLWNKSKSLFYFLSFIKLQYSAAASQLNHSLAHYHTALVCTTCNFNCFAAAHCLGWSCAGSLSNQQLYAKLLLYSILVGFIFPI